MLQPPLDPALEADWRRVWRRNSFIFIAYWGAALVAYGWMVAQDWEAWHFSQRQLGLSHALLLVMAVHLLVTLIEDREVWRYHWLRFFRAPASPHALAYLRISLCATIAVDLIFHAPQNWLPLAGLPHAARQPLPLIGWFIDILPISPTLYTIALALGIAAALMAAFGLFTRPALIALIPLTIYLFGVPQFYGKLSHYQFLVWVPMILAFTPCGRYWSLDALLNRIRGIRGDNRPSFEYALGVRWIMLTLAGIYFFSGIAKLQTAGLHWALSDNPVNLLRTEWLEQFETVPAVRLDLVPWLCQAAALGVILFELSYPLLLLNPRNHILLALEVIAFHTLNGYFLKIDFTYLKTAHVAYFPLERGAAWMGRRSRWLRWVLLWALLGTVGWLVNVPFLLPGLILVGLTDMVSSIKPRRRLLRLLLRMRSRLPKKGPSTAASDRKWLRASLVTGGIVLTLNSACGLLGIHTWPFSSYPAYAFVRESTVSYGWFEPLTADNQALDLDTEAKRIGFRKENILPMTERIVYAHRYDSTQLVPTILASWQRWQTEVPALQSAVRATVWIRELPLDPDLFGKVLSKTYLGRLELKEGEWKFVR